MLLIQQNDNKYNQTKNANSQKLEITENKKKIETTLCFIRYIQQKATQSIGFKP